MSAESRAFINKFADLVTGINHAVSGVADRCLTRNLIARETYDKVLQTGDTTQDKTRLVLTNIASRIEYNPKRFHDFVIVLREVLSCEEIVKGLEDELEDVKNRTKISQPDEGGLQKAQPMRQNQHQEKTNTTLSPIVPTVLAGRHLSKSPRPHQGKPPTPYSIPMKLRRNVIIKHLPKMKSAVEHLILPIAKKSRTKRIISREVYKKATNTKQSEEKRAHSLLHSVCISVRKDDMKFDAFIEILNCRSSCKELVKNIKQALEDVKAEHITQSLHHRKDDGISKVLESHSTQEQREHSATEETVIATASSTDDHKSAILLGGKTTKSKVHAHTIDPVIEAKHNRKLDEQQDHALIEDLNERVSKLKKEVKDKETVIKKKDEEIKEKNEEIKKKNAEIIDLKKQETIMDKKIHDCKQEEEDIRYIIKKISTTHPTEALKIKEKLARQEKKRFELERELAQQEKKKIELESLKEQMMNEIQRFQKSISNIETLRETQTAPNESQATLKETLSSYVFCACLAIFLVVIIIYLYGIYY